MLRSDNLLGYFWNRFLRIFPALIVVLILTVLLAPLIYQNENISYLSNPDVWSYIPNNLFIYRLQSGIDGIFEGNPLKHSINASLWTLCFEFTLYILASLLIIFKRPIPLIITLSIAFIFFSASDLFILNYFSSKMFLFVNSKTLIELGVYFIGGSLLAVIGFENFKFKRLIAITCLTIIFISLYFNEFYYYKHLLTPVIIFFGLSSTPHLNNIKTKIGDLSYGVYIYGFPIQQTLQHFFKLNSTLLTVYSLALSLIFGYLSWHLIEKNALTLKKLDLGLIYQKIKSNFSKKN